MSNWNRRLPPLSTLPVFEAAYRLRSFTRAADEVALSQASVSRRIRELEENLGVLLFERRRHDVVPTSEGDMLAASVHLTLHELASTTGRLRSIGEASSSFTIFSDVSLGAVMVTPLLSRFQQRYPELNIRVVSSYESIENVTEHFNIGLQVYSVSEDRFIVEPIADDAVFPVCSPELLARLPSPITAVDLVMQPLLHLEDVGKGWLDWRRFLATFRIKEPRPMDGMVFSSYQVSLEMAERSEGIALGWARTVQTRLDEGRLVRIPGMAIHLPEGVFVYRQKSDPENSVVDAFVQALRSSIDSVAHLSALTPAGNL